MRGYTGEHNTLSIQQEKVQKEKKPKNRFGFLQKNA